MDTEDVSTEVLYKLWPWLEANKNRLIGAGLVILVVAIIYSFMTWQHGQNEIAAGEAFTQLLFAQPGGTDPGQESDAFLALASKYAGTAAAQRAQLQAAGVLFEAGNFPEAATQFQKFADSHTGPLAATATLGLAASLEAQGKLDEAASAYQKLTSSHVNPDAFLQAQFSLGRLAERNGKLAEAESYYETAAESGRSGGTISEEAQRPEPSEIKMKLSATQKPTTNSFLK